MMPQQKNTRRVKSIAVVIGGLVVIAMIIWVDVATGLWNDLVIIAGLAAGLVSFLLTVLVLNRIVARATERKWAPVNRLALSEFLHAIADEKHSEVSRGHIVPRLLPAVDSRADAAALHNELHALRHHVVQERRRLSEMVGRWAEFLASSGSNEPILRHIAAIAFQLDQVRDAAVELEQEPGAERWGELTEQIQHCNESMLALESELRNRIQEEDHLMREPRSRPRSEAEGRR